MSLSYRPFENVLQTSPSYVRRSSVHRPRSRTQAIVNACLHHTGSGMNGTKHTHTHTHTRTSSPDVAELNVLACKRTVHARKQNTRM